MSRFRNLPLARKMLWLLLAASGTSLLAAVATVVVYDWKTYRPGEEAELKGLSEVLAPYLMAALAFGGVDDANEDLENLSTHFALYAACVYDAEARLFTSYVKPGKDFSCPEAPPGEGYRHGPGFLSYYRTLVQGENREGSLLVLRSSPPLTRRLAQYSSVFLSVLFALLAVFLFLTAALARLVSGPIRRLALAAREVRDQEDYTVRVEKTADDELGELTEAFNEMLATIESSHAELQEAHQEQEELQDALLQARKMESIGRLAGGVAHDFNNYLTVIVGSTDLALSQLPEESPVLRFLENVRKATGQASNLTQQLLAFARQQIIEPRVIDPARLLFDMEKMLRSLVGGKNEIAVIPHGEPWPIRVDPHQMTQVMMNLAANARDAMPGGGKVVIEIHNVELDQAAARDEPELEAGEFVLFRVVDTGVGMDRESLKRLFEPFFTTKEHGKGTGLGLATCYGIVKQNGGHIVVSSRPGRGSVFKIYMPRSLEEPENRWSAEPMENLPSGHETILVVEDNALVRQTAVSLLRAQGYTVIEAAGGPDAIRRLEDHDGELDLLVTDVVMPEMSGRDLADQLHISLPTLRVLYVSGYTDVLADAGELAEGIEFLQKPYTSVALMNRVRSLLDKRSPNDA